MKQQKINDAGVFGFFPFAYLAVGGGMSFLTFFVIKGCVQLIRNNEEFSIKQILISLTLSLVFLWPSVLFIRTGLRQLRELFKRND